jgi:nucleoside-diphosphate-sugar epimerase
VPSTDPATPVVAVTGATGYVGGLISKRFRAAGWQVVPLQRQVRDEATLARKFVLGEPIEPNLFAGVDLLIHCAYDLKLTDPDDIERVNVVGTGDLFEAAVAQSVPRKILISSMSAYWGTEQVYGRAKLACEETVSAAGGHSVRLGLVYGEGWGGMANSLRQLVQLPLTPLVGAHSYQYTVHENDVAGALYALGSADVLPTESVLGLAHPDRVPFRTLLEGFGRLAGATPRFVPVPWRPVYGAMRLAERVGVALPLRGDSLLGLVRPAGFVPRVGNWRDLGVTLRPFSL